ncbi:MAG: imelysin family protein [Bacteroidetes bacterium]|nr:imelysin family protein [Bacteroidota bacterium]
MQIRKSILLLGILAIALMPACKKDKDDQTDNFDRAAMLEVYRDEFIKPAFTNVNGLANTLETVATAFVNNQNTDNLEQLREGWKDAVLSWESACAYNFGPAGESGTRKTLNEEIATFPVSESKLETILNGGNYSLNDYNRDARGFFAIEFLIFNGTEAEIISRFGNANNQNFLLALCADINSRLNTVKSAWETDFGNEFTGEAGTSVGSPVSELYNEFVKSYEILKNYKFGLPLGLMSGQSSIEPKLVEAYYSGFSLNLAEAHFKALEEIWKGKNGKVAFRDWLNSVEGGPALVSETEAGFNSIQSKFDVVNNGSVMSELIENNPAQLIEIHTEIQKNTRFVKSEMSSLLGIAITYSSGDGD